MVGGGKDREEMSDLISRSELLKELESNKLQPTKDTDGFIDGWCEGFNTVVDMIRNQPTAFDTEKVVEQLEEEGQKMAEAKPIKAYGKSSPSCHRYYKAISVKKAIDIVKKGGVE